MAQPPFRLSSLSENFISICYSKLPTYQPESRRNDPSQLTKNNLSQYVYEILHYSHIPSNSVAIHPKNGQSNPNRESKTKISSNSRKPKHLQKPTHKYLSSDSDHQSLEKARTPLYQRINSETVNSSKATRQLDRTTAPRLNPQQRTKNTTNSTCSGKFDPSLCFRRNIDRDYQASSRCYDRIPRMSQIFQKMSKISNGQYEEEHGSE